MRKLLLFILTLSVHTYAAVPAKTSYSPGEVARFTPTAGKTIVLKNISQRGEPVIAELNKEPYTFTIPANYTSGAIGIYDKSGNQLEYSSYIRVLKSGDLTTYQIGRENYNGLPVYRLNGGMSAEYAVQKSLANLTGGISHTWEIGPGGGPQPVLGTPDFLEQSLDKTISLYNSILGENTPLETVIISTGVPSIPYLSAALQAPVLPIHYLVSVNSIKEIQSILACSSSKGNTCYATLGYDASMDNVGVAWIKLLDLPKQYQQFIADHKVKNVIIAGVGEDGKGESFCRKVKGSGTSGSEYSDRSVYILYTHSGSAQDIATISKNIVDYDDNNLYPGSHLADWESGITNPQIEKIRSQVSLKTDANPYTLIAPNNMMIMYDLAVHTAIEFAKNNKKPFGGSYLNEYLISQPMYEMLKGTVPLLYWQFVAPVSTVDRLDKGVRSLIASNFSGTEIRNFPVHVNARIGKTELVSELQRRGYSSVTKRADNQEEIWNLGNGINAPCEVVAQDILTTYGATGYKEMIKSVRPLSINQLSKLCKAVSGLQFQSFLKGSGTAENPYLIHSRKELEAMRNDLSSHYRIENPIDMSNSSAQDAETLSKTVKGDRLSYKDVCLPFEERAADLVARMTPEEKQSQMVNQAPEIARLGISEHNWWNEGLHGVARSGPATTFPVSLAMACMWDMDLMKKVGEVTAHEARGYNKKTGKKLSYWAPTINLARDPRWGRNEESFGEDPFLSGKTSVAFVKGMQGNDDRYLAVIATAKHFAANNSEVNRLTGSMDMDMRNLQEYYLEPFKRTVQEAGVQSIMTAYNQVNNVPMMANTYIVDRLLRKTWGFGGYVVTDCGAITFTYNSHRWDPDGDGTEYTPVTRLQAISYALKSGTDLNCDWSGYNGSIIDAVNSKFTPNYIDGLLGKVEQQPVVWGDVDKALTRLFTARMKTGEFDPPADVPYTQWGEEEIEAADHQSLALETAQKSVVLLKNEPAEGNATPILPMDGTKIKKIVVLGDFADKVVLGDYSGSPTYKTTPYQGITQTLNQINPQAQVELIKNGNEDAFFANIDYIEIIDDNGNVLQKIEAESATEVGGSMKKEATNLGYIKSGGWAKYTQANTSNAAKIRISYAGPDWCPTGVMQFRYGDSDGAVVSEVKTKATGGWNNYVTIEAPYTGREGGYAGTEPLYMKARSEQGALELTDIQKNTIREADAVVVFVGTDQTEQGENHDRKSVEMENNRADLVNLVAGLNKNTVAYIQAVGMVDIESFKANVPAILWTSYNGQAQGQAAADLLLGKVSPSAKLPFTWYTDLDKDVDDICQYNIRSPKGRTYQYFTGGITYPFGHGLSYARFEYSNLSVSANSVTPNDEVTVTVTVKNTSSLPAFEIVQLYVEAPVNALGADQQMPIKQLKGFSKVYLEAGESKPVEIKLNLSDLTFWHPQQSRFIIPTGEYSVEVARSAMDAESLSTTLQVQGEQKVEPQTVTLSANGVVMDLTQQNTLSTEITIINNDGTEYAGDFTVNYTSGDTSVATVDANGIITAVSQGSATITAEIIIDGRKFTSSVPVAIAKAAPGEWVSVGTPTEPFTGVLDGNGKCVYNFTITSQSDEVPTGFFSKLCKATVKNLWLDEMSINGGFKTGGISGEAEDCQIMRCSVSGKISGSGNYTGGLVGYISNTTESLLTDNRVEADVKAYFAGGGLVGQMVDKTQIDRCLYSGNVIAAGRGGGLVGYCGDESSAKNPANRISSSTFISGSVTRSESWTGQDHFHRLIGTYLPGTLINNRCDESVKMINVPSFTVNSGLNKADGLTLQDAQLYDKELYTSIGYVFGEDENAPWLLLPGDTPRLWYQSDKSSYKNTVYSSCPIVITPNPVFDYFTIKSDEIPTRIQLYTMQGLLINGWENTSVVNVSTLLPGSYFVKVNMGNKTETITIIKK